MRRRRSNPPRTFFQGNEFMRLMSMIVMLAVIFMLIRRSSDPNTWTWLAAGAYSSDEATTQSAPEKAVAAQDKEDKLSTTAAASDKHRAAIPKPEPLTDLVPEEKAAAAEEFQAVTDGTLNLSRIELNAYDRLLHWTENQTFEEMLSRAQKKLDFNQFFQAPDKYRGELFRLDLTAYLIRKSPQNFNGLELYEVWGSTDQSRVWVYDAVVIDLPKGLAVGKEIHEKVTVVGYFFKLQGYLEAGAKPRAAPLQAPMFIGRLVWRPRAMPRAHRSDWYWGLGLLLAFLAFIIIRLGLLLWRPRRTLLNTPRIPLKPDSAVEEWLAKGDFDASPHDEPDGSDFPRQDPPEAD
ncbi:MAG: hypothetical protein ACWGMZ_06955 [Thermoguttaceae bacterium]